MKCDIARDMMDERLQLLAEGAEGDRDWSALDLHLADCDACASDWAELLGVRNGLSDLAGDGPTTEEVDAMLAVVETRAFGRSGAGLLGMFDCWGKVIQSTPVRALLATAAVVVFSVGVTTLMDARKASRGSLGSSVEYLGVGSTIDSAKVVLGERFMSPSSGDSIDNQRLAGFEVADKFSGVEPGSEIGVTSTTRGTYLAQSALSAGAASVAASPQYENTEFNKSQPRREAYRVFDSHSPVQSVIEAGERRQKFGSMTRGRTEAEAHEVLIPRYTTANELGEDLDRFASENNRRRRKGKRYFQLPSEASGGQENVQSIFGQSEIGRTEERKAKTSANYSIAPSSEQVFEASGNLTLVEELERVGAGKSYYRDRPTDDENGLNKQSSVQHDAGGDEQTTVTQPAPVVRKTKVIKTGELGLEVESYVEASRRVESIVDEHGGFVADATTAEQAGGAMVGTMVVRVDPERFEGLFAALKSIGRVGHEHVKAADVTADWVDLEARIKGLLITENRLQELVQNKSIIDKVSALLEVERELTRVRSSVEQLQGQLRVMADRVGFSTMTVRLSEADRTVPRASFWIEVGDVQESLPALNGLVERLGAKLTSTETTKRDDGTFKADNSLVVSLAKFGEVLSAVDSLGRVKHRIVKDWESADAGATWADEVRCNVGIIMHERSYQLPAGTVQVEVSTLEDGMAALDAVLEAVGGAIANNTSRRNSDGSVSADLKLSVSAGRFAALVDRLGSIGRTLNKTVAGEAGEITGGASLVPCELSLTLSEPVREVPSGNMVVEVGDFSTATDRLSQLVDADRLQVLGSSSTQRNDGTWAGYFRIGVATSDMEDVVSAVEKLGRVTSRQVIGLGLGTLSRMDKDALGVIELTLTEPAAMRPSPDRASGPIRKAFSDGLAGLYSSLALIVRAVITAGPWLVMAMALLFVVSRARRRVKDGTG